MNMENILCTIKFSYHPMTDSQQVPKQRPWNPELAGFANFAELPKKTKLLENFELQAGGREIHRKTGDS